MLGQNIVASDPKRGIAILHQQWDISSTLDKELGNFQNGQETAAAATARIAPQLNNLLKEAVKG